VFFSDYPNDLIWVQAFTATVLFYPGYSIVILMVAMNAFHGWEELRSKWGRKMTAVIRHEPLEGRGDGQAAGSPMGLIHFVSKFGLSNHYDALTLELARQIIGCNCRLELAWKTDEAGWFDEVVSVTQSRRTTRERRHHQQVWTL
jgi:hypothetical protein